MNRLGTILVQAGKLSGDQLALGLREQDGKPRFLGDILTELGYVTADDVARALAVQLDIPYFELGDEFRLSPEEVRLVPESLARRFCMVPVKQDKGPTVTIVMKDPLDIRAVDMVQSLTNMEVHKAVSTEERILSVIDRFYREDAYIESNLKDIADLETAGVAAEKGAEAAMDAEQLRIQANDAPVVRFVNLLLMQAVRDRASDIHFEPGEKDVSVRLRVDGALRPVTPPPKSLYQAVVTRIKILSDMDIAERRLPLDGRFKFKAYGRVIDVRVSSLPEVYGEKLVLRILDRESLLVDMSQVGFEEALLRRFKRILNVPNGIILLTGPTGSGKTTTLYGALNFLRRPEVNIQTVEDPVEYLIGGINQMQIKPQIDLGFANALRSILRQDPDIIMIGEIRDLDTAQIAMRASLTGHLVFSTLHTNDSPSAFWRLQDIGIETYLIAATVKLVLSQRLVRLICRACRKDMKPTLDVVRIASQVFPDAGSWSYSYGAGCKECSRTGYRGRTAIFEFLEVTDPIRQMVLERTGEVEFRRRAIDAGMETLLANGLRKVKRGATTLEEVLSVCPLADEYVAAADSTRPE